MDTLQPCQMLAEGLLMLQEKVLGEIWTLMNDGAKQARYAAEWVDANNFHALDQPVKSSDMNLIEILWGTHVPAVFKNMFQFENVKDSRDAITTAWSQIELKYIKNSFKSIFHHLVLVIEKGGETTKY